MKLVERRFKNVNLEAVGWTIRDRLFDRFCEAGIDIDPDVRGIMSDGRFGLFVPLDHMKDDE